MNVWVCQIKTNSSSTSSLSQTHTTVWESFLKKYEHNIKIEKVDMNKKGSFGKDLEWDINHYNQSKISQEKTNQICQEH